MKRWLGRSLLELDEERTLFDFECGKDPETSTFAVLQGGRKVIGLENPEALRAGRVVAAFDLERDPREQSDLANRESWPGEELTRLRPTLEPLFVPLVGPREADLQQDKRSELDGLGYGGGEE